MTALAALLRASWFDGVRAIDWRALSRDRVLWAIVGVVALVTAIEPAEGARALVFTGKAIAGIAPFLLLAVAAAAYAKATGSDALIARAFSGHPARTIVAAALVGALSPFCSCGVIPLIAAMLAAGVPLAPVMAFWIASPMMDPEMFIVTAAGLGPGFAVYKLTATIGLGILGGVTVVAFQRAGYLLEPLAEAAGGGCRPRFDASAPARVEWRFWRDPARTRSFARQSAQSGVFLGKWLTLAFVLESVMLAYLPSESIAAAVGSGNAFAVPLAALVGVPAYLNGYAAVPLVGGLMDLGMTPGAAMAFVTAGAVSCIPAAVAVWAVATRPVFALYVSLALFGAMLAGWGFDATLSLLG